MRRRLITIAALSLPTFLAAFAAPAPAAQGVSAARTAFVPGQVVVKFEGQRVGRSLRLPAGVDVQAGARALRRNPRVDYAVPNYIATASAGVPNDPGTAPGKAGPSQGWTRKQWNFLPCGTLCDASATKAQFQSRGGIDALGAWRNLARAGHWGAAGVRIAVLDTGIAYRSYRSGRARFLRSPDFSANQFTEGYDFVKNDPIALDENGHGTHIAGTIGEGTNNGIGVTGLAYRARLMPVRVLNSLGRGSSDDIARGIRFAANRGADVINMSFNFACGSKVKPVTAALEFAHKKGAVLVASAGNIGSETCVSPPATMPDVIGVAGTTEGGCLGDYSLAGDDIDVSAPGGGTPAVPCASDSRRPIFQVTLRGASTVSFGLPNFFVGTSMAAAHVSGVAAMVIASGVLGSNPSPDGVAQRLKGTARDLGADGRDPSYGAGLIDAAAATDPKL